MRSISIVKKSGDIEGMSDVEFARWGCLVEALTIIQEKATELGVEVDKMIKPVAIEHYIEERYPSILHDVRVELELGLLF